MVLGMVLCMVLCMVLGTILGVVLGVMLRMVLCMDLGMVLIIHYFREHDSVRMCSEVLAGTGVTRLAGRRWRGREQWLSREQGREKESKET